MRQQVAYSLANPVFDPERQINASFGWFEERDISALLTWKAEAVRDRIMRGVGTEEPWVVEEMSAQLGDGAFAVHYRRPLRIDEVARMGQTAEVKERPGRG